MEKSKAAPNNSNIILTGLPRSGTTLTCYLLNKLPNIVALHEPLNVARFRSFAYHETICDHIEACFQQIRKSLLKTGSTISKHIDGQIPANPYGAETSANGLRKGQDTRGLVEINKSLSDNFLLVVKHCAAFSALLETLQRGYHCYAIVRNPLSVLASWNSIDTKHHQGHIPAAEDLDQALTQTLSEIPNQFERQFYILAWFFGKYRQILPPENILYYENIVASRGCALKVITPQAINLNQTLENKNNNKLYKRELMLILGEKLLKTEGPFWTFYSKESVERLLLPWEAAIL